MLQLAQSASADFLMAESKSEKLKAMGGFIPVMSRNPRTERYETVAEVLDPGSESWVTHKAKDEKLKAKSQTAHFFPEKGFCSTIALKTESTEDSQR